jgi:hypothetical protein
MSDHIWDGITGRQLAWIDKGVLFSVETEQECATVRDGELYSLKGERLGLHLQSLGAVREETPEAFLRLLGDDFRSLRLR